MILFLLHRSFVPPVRDEESETQRKAHAKRVRETRRSTQGVTLEEIKSAEELVKKQNQQNPSQTNNTTTNNTEQVNIEKKNFLLTFILLVILYVKRKRNLFGA